MYNLIQQMSIEERHVLLQNLDSEEVQKKLCKVKKNHVICSHTITP